MFGYGSRKLRKSSIWLQIQIAVLMIFGTILLYLIMGLLSPHFQEIDQMKCGVDILLGITCNFRFNG